MTKPADWPVRPAKTQRMPRQIWVFAGRTGYFVGFVVLRLIIIIDCENALLNANIKVRKYVMQIRNYIFHFDDYFCMIYDNNGYKRHLLLPVLIMKDKSQAMKS